MHVFDARVVAVDGAALVAGTLTFFPNADNATAPVREPAELLSVEIGKHVMHIRPVSRALQRADGFFDVEYGGARFSSEKITSTMLAPLRTLNLGGRQETVWAGASGILHLPCTLDQGARGNYLHSSLGRLRFLSSLSEDGLEIWLSGEIDGVVFVGNTAPESMPKGHVEITFTLPWSWIALKGWQLLWAMPQTENETTMAVEEAYGEDARNFRSLLLHAPSAQALIAGTFHANCAGPSNPHEQALQCTHFVVDIEDSYIRLQPHSGLERLPTGLARSNYIGPFIAIVGLGLRAMSEVLEEADEGTLEIRSNSAGTITVESDEDRQITQPIELIRASIERGETGISLSITGAAGPLRIEIYGERVTADEEQGEAIPQPIESFAITALIPISLLRIRYNDLLRTRPPGPEHALPANGQ